MKPRNMLQQIACLLIFIGINVNIGETMTTVYDNSSDVLESGRLLPASPTATAGTYNYMVTLLVVAPSTTTADGKLCTGALISLEYVITVASCVADATAITVNYAATGSGAGLTGTPVTGASAILHPKYGIAPSVYNIALVKLPTALTASATVGFIELAYKYNTDESKDLEAKSVRVLGYGDSNPNAPLTPYALRAVSMTVMNKITCTKLLISNELNVRPQAFQECLDTANGIIGGCNTPDLGAAVTLKFTGQSAYTLVGVLDYYRACATTTPNMFVRIAPFLDWIRKYVTITTNAG